MKKLSNGTENQQTRDNQWHNITSQPCIAMAEALINQMKKLSNGTENQQNKVFFNQMKKLSNGTRKLQNKDMQVRNIVLE
uniref:Uncharacterized protein n=1 Tax=Plectus sambesii TaxID=2011161 RepID=A0A914WQI7_9BILA